MTKRLQISIPKENPYAFTSCALMAASGIIRLWHYLPGEMDWDKYDAAMKNGWIEIPDAMADSLKTLSEKIGLNIEWLSA